MELSLTSDGKKLAGPFVASEGKTTTFVVPAGKLKWTPSWGDMPCEGGGDEPKMQFELAAGETAHLHCWQSAKMGMCCEFKGSGKR